MLSTESRAAFISAVAVSAVASTAFIWVNAAVYNPFSIITIEPNSACTAAALAYPVVAGLFVNTSLATFVLATSDKTL